MIDWLDGLNPVTDVAERARLARWAVALRRAQAAGTGQTTGMLAVREDFLESESVKAGYCCLGIWCEVEVAAGRLQRREHAPQIQFLDAEIKPEPGYWNGSTLPAAAMLNGSDNPDLLRFVPRDGCGSTGLVVSLERLAAECGYEDVDALVAMEAETYCAADLNDDMGLSFAEIADVVVWRFGLTPEELATAEQEPRVPMVEGPEVPGSREPGQ